MGTNKNNQPNRRISLDDLMLRGELKGSDSKNDIGDVWERQKMISKHQQLLEREYKRSKQRAKLLKKRLKKHQKPYISQQTSAKMQQVKLRVQQPVVRVLQNNPLASKVSKKQVTILFVSICVFGVGVIVWQYSAESRQGPSATLADTTSAPIGIPTSEVDVDSLSFQYVYPQDFEARAIELRLQRRGEEDIATYKDSLLGVRFTVSQLKATADVSNPKDTRQLENLAKSLPVPATTMFVVDGRPVFIGQEGNQQSLAFVVDGALVFIRVEGVVEEGVWAQYIASLI